MIKISTITLGLVLLASTAVNAQNVGINTSEPDASAVLDVKSTTQGLLIPRMTKVQREAIATPAKGLMVYQTDDTQGFYFHNGTVWTTLNSGAQIPNGTTAGQIYLTSSASPFTPTPVTLSGDLVIGPTGTTSITSTGTNSSVYAARKTTGISLLSLGLFPTGFRSVNFLNAERTIGSAALFNDTDNTYTIPSTGIYQIGYSFRYGTGLQPGVLTNSPGVGILRIRAGVATLIDSRSFLAADFGLISMTISENSLNSIYSFQAGDKISLGLTGSTALTAGILNTSVANFYIYKVSN